jgi:hypothetical protein
VTVVITGRQPVRVITAGDGPGVLVNRDTVNPVFTSVVQGFDWQDVTASVHDALIGLPYDGDSDLYATVQPGQSVVMDYMRNAKNWGPSPGQAAAQINALGLAKDSSVNAPAYGPAKDSSVNGPAYGPVTVTDSGLLAVESGGNLESILQQTQTGIPPNVQNLQSANLNSVTTAGNPTVINTFASAGRIWAVILSLGANSNAAFVAAVTPIWVQLEIDHALTIKTLAILQSLLTQPSQITNQCVPLPMYGYPFAAGDTLQLDVNNGVGPANTAIRAAVHVLYTTP